MFGVRKGIVVNATTLLARYLYRLHGWFGVQYKLRLGIRRCGSLR